MTRTTAENSVGWRRFPKKCGVAGDGAALLEMNGLVWQAAPGRSGLGATTLRKTCQRCAGGGKAMTTFWWPGRTDLVDEVMERLAAMRQMFQEAYNDEDWKELAQFSNPPVDGGGDDVEGREQLADCARFS